MSQEARKGSSSSQSHRDLDIFKQTLRDCDLLDAGFQGDPFTWKKGNVEIRLDRCFCNLGWRVRFQEAIMQHLPHLKSDHRPLLLRFKRECRRNMRRRPFRFEAAWIKHDDFPAFVRRSWGNTNGTWNEKIQVFQGDLRKWNKEVFGLIGRKKLHLMRRLEWLDHQTRFHDNGDLVEEQIYVWREYEKVLAQEEIMWYQKSRAKWLKFGDRNTRYFHGVTTIRRRKNSYDMLQDDNDEWISETYQLEKHVSTYYKNLFHDEEPLWSFGLSGMFPIINAEEMQKLERRVSDEEIYQTVKRIGSFKAPGPDGFQAIFFQNQWQVIGKEFCILLQKFFDELAYIKEINGTLLTSIPKKDVVTCMNDFRPISLCNVSYKTVIKIIAQRIRGLMGSLVGPQQSSFVPRRHSGDNIIVA